MAAVDGDLAADHLTISIARCFETWVGPCPPRYDLESPLLLVAPGLLPLALKILFFPQYYSVEMCHLRRELRSTSIRSSDFIQIFPLLLLEL